MKNKNAKGEKKEPPIPANPSRGKHLEGLPEEEIRMIQLIAEIFVNAVVNHKKI